MPKFHGEVGYSAGSVEEPAESGIWVDDIVERTYYGDVVKQTRNLEAGEPINSDISVTNMISIVADAYAFDNYVHIKYIRWAGVLWTVTSVNVQHPRLVLSLGKVYNGPIFVEEGG